MRVGDAQALEHALDRAVLAARAVQRVEDDVGARRERGEERFEVARHVDAAYVVADRSQRVGAAAAGHGAPSAGRPMRRISQSSVTPQVSCTRRRTSSPRPSRSAAVALPVLMRKLACFSETMAPPRVRPRQPARSISSQALWPGGLAKVEPPVRARIGCDDSRAAWISPMRRPIAAASPGSPANTAWTKIHSSATPLWR